MKKNYFIGVGLCLFLSLQVFAQDLIITGVYDGPLSGGTPKGVELYVQNEIPDLSVYGLGVANNGDGSDGIEFTFPTESASQHTFIYVTTNLEQFEAYFGLQANYQTGNITVNGDDAIELFYHENLIDVFGDANTDGSGTDWEYTDGWAYRKNNSQPKTSFSASDWSFSGVNAFDNTSVNSDANPPFPMGSFSNSNVLSASGNQEIDFRIYPNPTKTKQIIISTQSTTFKKLLILDILGKKVFSKNLEEEQSLVDLQGLKSGIYILKVAEGAKMFSKKLIIQ